MPKQIKNLLLIFALLIILILPYLVFAANPALDNLEGIRADSGYAEADETSVAEITGYIVNAFLGILGVIFIVLMLYAGYTWMTAAGDESKITKAGNTIRRAIIGLLITVGAYAIWTFIFDDLIFG